MYRSIIAQQMRKCNIKITKKAVFNANIAFLCKV